MLDKNALSQLKTLKQEIHDQTPRHQGRVRATSGRFGFVNTDDGQQFFLSPDEMDKVLATDRIEFRVESIDDKKQQAIVEKVVSSELKTLFGRYVVRGKGHFIEPDNEHCKRWIFIPPAKRNKAKDGDLIRATITQHPFPHARAQAQVDEVIGQANDAYIEHQFIQQKFALESEFNAEVSQQLERLLADSSDKLEGRTDLTHLPFVTIDSAGTRDIDDALYAEAHSQGWSLWIAIADPAAYIEPGSALDLAASKRATSVYFPDQVLPMLPPELSEQLCSLQENELRAAMVVELKVAESGAIEHCQIHNAKITSQAKLSYSQVAGLIAGEDGDIAAELHGHLLHLHNCSQALAGFRQQHCLVMEERPDYKIITDEHGKARDIVRIERNDAHRLVEECMLACNRSVADWLAQQNSGFFITHAGVRTERIGEVVALLREQFDQQQKPKIQQLDQYIHWLQQAEKAESELPLRTIISRQLERSFISLEAKPHFGLGFEHYTTFTSPLRKYNDLLLHRLIKRLLDGSEAALPQQEQLDAISQQQLLSRQAATQSEIWLKLNWLVQQQQELEQEAVFEATIVHMNSSQFTVRLEDTGIEGTVDRRKAKGNWVFETKTLSHRSDDQRFILNQPVKVKVVDTQPMSRAIRFALV